MLGFVIVKRILENYFYPSAVEPDLIEPKGHCIEL